MTPVEPIYAALFSLVSQGEGLAGKIAWTNPDSSPGALAYTSRRVKTFDDLQGKQPALCQAEPSETIRWRTNQDPAITLDAHWLIYLNAGDPNAVPAQTTNLVLDQIKALFVDVGPEGVQHLQLVYAGGVYRVWIEGTIEKFQGDLDGQTLLVVPIKILAPQF